MCIYIKCLYNKSNRKINNNTHLIKNFYNNNIVNCPVNFAPCEYVCVCVCVCEGARGAMETETRVQFLAEIVCISHWANTLVKGIRVAYSKFPDFFRLGTFIDGTHMKL